jgi:hypothetical protein
MEPTPLDYMIALGIVAGCFVFLVCCVMLLLIAIVDNIRIHIKRSRLRRKRGNHAHRYSYVRKTNLPGPGHQGHQGEHA